MKSLFSEKYFLYNCCPNDILIKVDYTNKNELLTPQIVNDYSIFIGKLGRHKKKCWEFQKEWRYILRFSPIGFKEIVNHPIDSLEAIYKRYCNPTKALPFKYFYLTLEDDALDTMEITLSPKLSEGYRTIIQLLKQKYNPKMIIKNSSLSNDIR